MRRAACPLHAAATRHPDAPAIVSGPEKFVSCAECDAQASSAAAALLARGVQPGERIALLGPVDATSVPVLVGAFRAGIGVYIPNTRLPEATLRENLERLACRFVIGPGSEGLASIDLIRHAHDLKSVDVDLDAPATLLGTSGSTAAPKMAVHSIGNHLANAEASNRNIVLEFGDRWLLSLPLYHVAGLGIVFRSILAGAAVAIPSPAETLEESIIRLGVTHASLVATQLQRMLETPAGRDALAHLKAVLLGGGPVPEGLVEQALQRGVPIHNTYGLTETASQVTTTPPEADAETLRTSGKPLRPNSIRIEKDGEIQVSGPMLFLGYLEDDGTLRKPLTGDGWFPTGDLGRFDDRGNLIVTGRKDNMFISGGENIQPEEIEAALCALTEVVRAIVVPVTDTEFGHRPAAFVESALAGELDPAMLAARLQAHLPRYKLPVAYLPWPADAPEMGIKPPRPFFRDRAAEWRREQGMLESGNLA